jgi:hypothetical protein
MEELPMKKNIVGLISLFLVFVSLSGQIQAADSSSGCGLGWAVFKKNSLISSALRATTNAMFFNTVAMTFGTSGCARHSIVQNDKKALHFMDANKHQLMTEVAMGGGEYVSGLGTLMGCDETLFAQTLQRNYGEVFTGEKQSARELVNRVQAQVLLNKDLAAGCAIL